MFVAQSAVFLPVARMAFAREPLTPGDLGVQLYTVRSIINQDPAKVLREIQDIGYKNVECTFGNLNQIWPSLKQTTLRAVSVHLDGLESGEKLTSTMADLKQRGFEYVVVPYLDIVKGGTEGLKRTADSLTTMGEKAVAQGLTFCYHNHAHDFSPLGDSNALDLLLKATNPQYVQLELDVFWVTVAGLDPVKILQQYGGRVPLLHLKDKSKTFTKTQFNENVPPGAFASVGSGSVDFPAILSIAAASGVRYYFVEQDQTPGDPIAALRKSYDYLKTKFK
jgi:sugar phosphate isomerase/epimerase